MRTSNEKVIGDEQMGSPKHLEGSNTLHNEVEDPHSRGSQSDLDTGRGIFHNYHSAKCSPCSTLAVMEMV